LHDTHPKPLRITGLKIDGRSVAGPAMDVPPGTREIRIDYALLSWFREADSRFRTQLVGYDAAASEWSEQNFRSFSALPPGHYVLRVEAHDHAGNLSTPIEVPITIEAAWWQTAWAKLLAVLVVLLAGSALMRWRTRRLRAQRRELERAVAERTAELHAANQRLRALSYRDELTGLDNRRRLLEVVSPAADGPQPRTLILLDVDHFKGFNDRFGHLAGDEALRRVATAMRDCTGPDTTVARHGGEEFACVLPDMDAARAVDVAECIRAAVADCAIPVPGHEAPWHVTVSAGVATGMIATREDMLRLFNDADLALYQAKRQGRNRVQLHRA
jgi:diguanylate cyclase (GGDEF)-like protein